MVPRSFLLQKYHRQPSTTPHMYIATRSSCLWGSDGDSSLRPRAWALGGGKHFTRPRRILIKCVLSYNKFGTKTCGSTNKVLTFFININEGGGLYSVLSIIIGEVAEENEYLNVSKMDGEKEFRKMALRWRKLDCALTKLKTTTQMSAAFSGFIMVSFQFTPNTLIHQCSQYLKANLK